MNRVDLIGRLTKEIEIRQAGSTSVAYGTVACDRKYKKEGQPTADFINFKAFGKTADNMKKFFSKGSRIGLTGSWQTGSYTNKNGEKVYTNELMVDSFDFIDSKKSPADASADGFMNLANDIDEEVPFA